MAAGSDQTATSADPWADQRPIPPHVARTLALTIPQLIDPLDGGVTNAYLLCRIAETIEDAPRLTVKRKSDLQEKFLTALQRRGNGHAFAQRVARHAGSTPPS